MEKSWLRWCWRRALPALCVLVCLGLAASYWVWTGLDYAGPLFADVRAGYSRSETELLDRNGVVIRVRRTTERGRRLNWTPLEEISPALLEAVLMAEDQRFYRHHGVDWTALAKASVGLLQSGGRGASTISMQLAARFEPALQPEGHRRTLAQKWRQIRAALALERRWSKKQILEAWLNLISFRGELQGVTAASAGLFDKKPHGLTRTEAVILAALIRSPNAEVGQVIRRATALADALGGDLADDMDAGPGHDAIAATATNALTHSYTIRPPTALAYHVMQILVKEARDRNHGVVPAQIVATLDGDLQRFATETLQRHIARLGDRNVRDGALLVLDNRSGEALAYVGNTGAASSARYVDGVRARRQAGSTLKPFIYGLALDKKILTAATLLDDSPADLADDGGLYRPTNYDGHFNGPVSVRVALASSLNIPAVRALALTGVDAGVQTLTAAGFTSLEDAEHYGLSLALGAADVTLWDLTNAYRSLACGGQWSPARLTPDVTTETGRRVLSPAAAFIISDILGDRESRSRTFNLESPLATRFRASVKTGTSKDMRDNWCIGYSDRYTVGVWAGNFSGESMWNVSGISGAAPVWVEVMNWLHRGGGENAAAVAGGNATAAPKPPAGVISAAVAEGGRREWFIRGTENALQAGRAAPPVRIVYPPAGAIIALDPDIPPDDQKVFFEAHGVNGVNGVNGINAMAGDFHWLLDGQPLGSADNLLLWSPLPGRHILTLTDASGKSVDEVRFEVRGAIIPDNETDRVARQ